MGNAEAQSVCQEHARFLGARLHLVAGKGGSGKTTVASALALLLAQGGRRVLLASAVSGESLGTLLGVRPRPRPRRVAEVPRLWVWELDVLQALEDFGGFRLGHRFLVRHLVRARPTKPFLDALPGLRALALLGRVWHSVADRPGREYDAAVLEVSGLGHLPRLLTSPGSVAGTLPQTVLRADLEELHEALFTPDLTSVLLVAHPERYSLHETEELLAACRLVGRPPDGLVVNRVLPSWIPACADKLSGYAPEAYPQILTLLAHRAENQREIIERLKGLGLPHACLPELPGGPAGLDRMRQLAESLGQGWASS